MCSGFCKCAVHSETCSDIYLRAIAGEQQAGFCFPELGLKQRDIGT